MLEVSVSSKDSEDLSFSDADFSYVREVMYKYSKKAEERFFQVPELAFLFVHFTQNPKSLTVLKKKFEVKGAEYFSRILKDISDLKKEAILALNNPLNASSAEKSAVYLHLLSALNSKA